MRCNAWSDGCGGTDYQSGSWHQYRLVKQSHDQWVLLTDIIGDEDHYGDMDFKVAGTPDGITGIQLDLKIDGISEDIVRATLKQAREARMEILRKMITAIPRPRTETSRYAPRLLRTKIDPDKIGLLIGPGGKNIRAIQEDTGATSMSKTMVR